VTRKPPTRIGGIHVRTVLREQPNEAGVAAFDGEMEQRVALGDASVRLRAQLGAEALCRRRLSDEARQESASLGQLALCDRRRQLAHAVPG